MVIRPSASPLSPLRKGALSLGKFPGRTHSLGGRGTRTWPLSSPVAQFGGSCAVKWRRSPTLALGDPWCVPEMIVRSPIWGGVYLAHDPELVWALSNIRISKSEGGGRGANFDELTLDNQ